MAAEASAPLVVSEKSQFCALCALEHRRKNWLFSDTQAGAHASAGIYSIVTTARANGLKTFEYLAWVLSEMPRAEASGNLDAARFLPWSPDVPESCRAPMEEGAAMFADEPVVDVDVDEYEEIINS